MSVVAILSHRVRELCDSVAGRSQPRLDLWQVEDDLPVGSGVERWRFLRPEAAERREDVKLRYSLFHIKRSNESTHREKPTDSAAPLSECFSLFMFYFSHLLCFVLF